MIMQITAITACLFTGQIWAKTNEGRDRRHLGKSAGTSIGWELDPVEMDPRLHSPVSPE